MSDEEKPSSKPTSDGPPKRRRRRRRKPAGESDAAKPEGKPAEPARESSPSPRKRRNRGTRSGRNPSQEGESSSERSPSNPPTTKRRRRSRKKPGSAAADARTPEPQKREQTSPAPRPPKVEERSLDSENNSPPPRLSEIQSTPAPPTIRWGDDRDAPTPDISLPPDLPQDTARDDLDPTSAYLLEGDGEFQGALSARICNIISVRFATAGRLYLYDAGSGHYDRGDQVWVEGDRGQRLATVAVASRRAPPPRSLKKIVGKAQPSATPDADNDKLREILKTAKAEARTLGVQVKVFQAAFEDGKKKLIISYSCENKTDVRKLSRSLSNLFPYRVDLRHTGVRDEAKIVGGIGSCGQELCCSTWLPAFVPVSIKNAKDQGLVLNPTKVSGQCGRLKCCLVYEQAHYSELRKGLPKLGKRVITHDGFEGRVIEVDVLHQRIRVGIGRGDSKVYGKGEVKPMFASQPPGPGKKKDKSRRQGTAAPEASPAEEEPGEPRS